MDILVNISVGELLDKISILEIKKERISDSKKLEHINKELNILRKICDENVGECEDFINRLKDVNEKIWDIEDSIRKKESTKEFDERFIELARGVYFNNDLRFRIKDEINKHFGSVIFETKQYDEYDKKIGSL
jgi:predicted nuclease with TOPRIM domain